MQGFIDEILNNNGNVKFTITGTSMLPLLHNNIDEVIIEKNTSKIKKYDIIFYKRKNNQDVLHRVVGKNKDGFILRGDNQFVNEYGITTSNIIGVVTSIIRNGKELKLDSIKYKIYSILWVNSMWLRKIILGLKRKIK